jgi:hypothetical protein
MYNSLYPCLCLCFLTLQETRTTPSRLNILHSLQTFLTDARTFIVTNFYFFFLAVFARKVTLPRLRS